jgi:hypothetical protein
MSSLPFVWRKVLRDSSVDRTAKLVGFVLATYMDSGGLAWPSRDTLAAGASITSRAVDLAVPRLEAAGLLKVERDYRGGRSKVNKYLAVIPETANAVHIAEAETANRKQQTANATAQTAKAVHPKLKNKKKTAAADRVATPPETIEYCLGSCGRGFPESVLKPGNGWCPDCAPEREAW